MPEPVTTTATSTANPNFLMNKYRILGKKGEGTFSEVLKCQNTKDGSYWACKKMKQHYESAEQVNSLREIQALRRLSPHNNILELHEVIFDKKTGTLVLVCELMDMNIYELIRGRRHYLPEKKIKLIMHQLLKSVNHMHRNGIFHRDVKPENILIKDDLLKLADFGSCRSVYSKQPYTEYISTRWYRAPECLLTDGYYTYKMDIWSVGCVFYEILTLHPLFPGSNEVDQIAKIHDIMGTPDPSILNKLRNKTRGMNFNFPQKKGTGIEKVLQHAPPECVQLIYQMCAYDPDERISAKQALKHAYFKDVREAERKAVVLPKPKQDTGGGVEAQDTTTTTKEEGGEGGGGVSVKAAPAANNNQPAPVPAAKKDTKSNKTHTDSTSTDKLLAPEGPTGPPPPARSPRGPAGLPHKKKASTSPVRAAGTGVRPSSGGSNSSVPRYPASILHNRDPLYNYHRREKRRRRKMRMTEPSPVNASTTGLLPKVSQSQTIPTKNLGYQPSFQFGPGTLPKIGGATNTTTTATFLPSLGQAFVKPAKPKQMAQAGAGQPTKNIFGHYQLPSIDRRGGGH